MLQRQCEPAGDEERLSVTQDLVDTMRASAGCVGLAAPQIGVPLRIAVVDVRSHRLMTSSNGLVVLANAELLEGAGQHVAREGCLSLPHVTADIARAEQVRVLLPGKGEIWSAGFEARAIQHELDHLDGVLILDRVTSVHALHPRKRY
jgi:peptide deformylase